MVSRSGPSAVTTDGLIWVTVKRTVSANPPSGAAASAVSPAVKARAGPAIATVPSRTRTAATALRRPPGARTFTRSPRSAPCAGPGRSRALRQQFGRPAGQSPLAGVGQPVVELVERNPSDFGDLDVGVGQLSTDRDHQEVVDAFVDTASLDGERVVDAAQPRGDPTVDPGLLGDLADGRLLGGLSRLHVPLGQRPAKPTTSIQPP